jgi:hypothetical protein
MMPIKDPPRMRPEILLQPNIPKPLHGLAPRTVLGGEWWEATKFNALLLAGGYCRACGVNVAALGRGFRLECHEVYKIDYKRGRMYYQETLAICSDCHEYIHDGRLWCLLQKKQITKREYNLVMKHGRATLRMAGFKYFKPVYPLTSASWSKWRLVVNEVEYGPAFRNEKEWRKAYAD